MLDSGTVKRRISGRILEDSAFLIDRAHEILQGGHDMIDFSFGPCHEHAESPFERRRLLFSGVRLPRGSLVLGPTSLSARFLRNLFARRFTEVFVVFFSFKYFTFLFC